jgi:hypothetical protein
LRSYNCGFAFAGVSSVEKVAACDKILVKMAKHEALRLIAEERARHLADIAPVIQSEVQKICASAPFRTSHRSRVFLEYVVKKALAGRFDDLKERVIGSSLFGRPAGYDTGADSMVRVVANETRKRLQAYYAQPQNDGCVRIELPAGSYLPSVHHRPPALDDQHGKVGPRVAEQPPPAQPFLGKLIGPRTWMAGMLLLAGLCVFLFVQNRSLQRQVGNRTPTNSARVTEPWSTLFTGNRGLQILLADTSVGGIQTLLQSQLPFADYVNRRYIPDENRIAPQLDRFLHFLLDNQYTSVAYATTAVRIAQLAQSCSVPVSVSYARDMSLRTFKSGASFVVLGTTRANPWAQLFEPQLNFSVEFTNERGEHEPIMRNRVPRHGEPSAYVPGPGPSATIQESYGHLAFLPSFYKGGHMLLVTGTGSPATEAAGEFVTNMDRLRDALIKLGVDPSGEPQSFEILLRVRDTSGTPIQSEVISGRLHPASERDPNRVSLSPSSP